MYASAGLPSAGAAAAGPTATLPAADPTAGLAAGMSPHQQSLQCRTVPEDS